MIYDFLVFFADTDEQIGIIKLQGYPNVQEAARAAGLRMALQTGHKPKACLYVKGDHTREELRNTNFLAPGVHCLIEFD